MSHVSSHATTTANGPDTLSKLNKKFGRTNLAVYFIIFLTLTLCPLFLNNYWLLALNNIGLYAVLALSLNIVLGNTGLFNMGHMAFYAIGAYTTAILNTQFQVPVLWLMPISGIFAGIAALFVAWPVIRLRGDYLLIVTIAVVKSVFTISGNWSMKFWSFSFQTAQNSSLVLVVAYLASVREIAPKI